MKDKNGVTVESGDIIRVPHEVCRGTVVVNTEGELFFSNGLVYKPMSFYVERNMLSDIEVLVKGAK